MKIAYLDCFSGISGDMFLGALVDAGVPLSILQEAISSLGLGTTLALERVSRSGINSAKVNVLTPEGEFAELASPALSVNAGQGKPASPAPEDAHGDSHQHPHEDAEPHAHGRSLSTIEAIINGSPLPEAVKSLAVKAFRLLGEAEAKIHSVPVESIHFHEVGAVDAIADIVATSAGVHWLQAEQWLCSPLNLGEGHVYCAHGKLPVPAPATLELLRDLPVYSSGIKKELVTPTGAALLRALEATSSGFPAMTVKATGYGAGSREIPGQPNVLRLVIGEAAVTTEGQPGSTGSQARDRLGIIESTIDDATPELLAYVADRLLSAGASDVYRTPVQMKKGRIGVLLTVLCSPARAEALQRLIFMETTTLGLHYREEEKRSLVRSFMTVETEWGPVRIKLGVLEGKTINAAPEFEDCRKIAETHDVALKLVMQAAVAAYQAKEQPV